MQKAFYTVSHQILLKQLDAYGLDQTTSKWVPSYLSEKTGHLHGRNCVQYGNDTLWSTTGINFRTTTIPGLHK